MTRKRSLTGEPIEETKKDSKKISKEIIRGVDVYIPEDEHCIPYDVPSVINTEEISDIKVMIDAALLDRDSRPVMLIGPKGQAKTLTVAKECERREIPLIQFDCSKQTKRYDLIGRFVPAGEKIVFQVGDLGRAIHLANEYGQAMICFEEINALTPNMQKVLNQLLDWRRHLYVPEIGRTFTVDEGCQLGILATCNPSNYGGVFEINEDLKSRFMQYKMRYPEKPDERKIINGLFDGNGLKEIEPYVKGFISLADETRRGARKSELYYALSTRDVYYLLKSFIDYIEIFKSKGDDDPIGSSLSLLKKVCISKFKQANRDFIETRWRETIGSMDEY